MKSKSRQTHAIEVVREGDSVNLVLNLVARPFAFDKPRKLRFSLQATPVRPLDDAFRADLTSLKMQAPFPGFNKDGWDWNGSRLRLDGKAVIDGHGSQPYPLNWNQNIAKRKEWEKRGGIFTPYQSQLNIMAFGEAGDPRMPAGKQVSDVYGYLFPHVSAGALEHGNLSITRPDMESRLWCYATWIRHAGIRGLYFDQTEPTLGANPAAGAGYILDLHDRPQFDGQVQPGYLLTNVREFYKRLYTLFAQAGVERPMIWLHTTDATMISVFSFAGAFLEGENMPYLTPEQPWISKKFDASRMQAVSNPSKLGIGAVWLSMFQRDWNWPDVPQIQYAAMRAVQGYAMLSRWWGRKVGDIERVLPPYTGVKRVSDNSVQVLMREYELTSLGLPAKIQSSGELVTASPARVVVVIDGKQNVIDLGKLQFTDVKDWRVSFQGQASGASLKVHATGWVEQDGLVYVDLTYGPAGDEPVTVDRISIGQGKSQTSQTDSGPVGLDARLVAQPVSAWFHADATKRAGLGHQRRADGLLPLLAKPVSEDRSPGNPHFHVATA